MIAPAEPQAAGQSQDFARLVELQQEHTRSSTELERIETEMTKDSQAGAAKHTAEYVCHQERKAAVETEIKALFARNPQWLDAGEKTVKTPFGSVSSRTATSLEIPDEDATVALLELRAARDKDFDASLFIRTRKVPNVEALESLTDAELSKLGVTRTTTERVTVKPAKVDATKVVKAAKKKAAQPA